MPRRPPECLRGDGEHLYGEFDCFCGDFERRREDIGGLRGEFERRRGDLERSQEDLDCLNGDRGRRIGDLVRLRGDLNRATKGGEKRREMFRISFGEEGGGVRYR